MINEWINTSTKQRHYSAEYPPDNSPYWIAVVPAHRLCKEGYSYYEYSSDWAADANVQIRQFVGDEIQEDPEDYDGSDENPEAFDLGWQDDNGTWRI